MEGHASNDTPNRQTGLILINVQMQRHQCHFLVGKGFFLHFVFYSSQQRLENIFLFLAGKSKIKLIFCPIVTRETSCIRKRDSTHRGKFQLLPNTVSIANDI